MLKKLNISIILTITIVMLSITSIFAWYYGGDKIEKLILVTDSEEIEAKIYLGNDTNKDGVLEQIGEVNNTSNLRVDNINNYYTSLDQNVTTEHNEFTLDSMLTYKIVVLNPSLTESYKINMSLSSLSKYLNDTLLSDTNINHYITNYETGKSLPDLSTYFALNSARLTFKLVDLKVNIYGSEDESTDNSIDSGYPIHISSSEGLDSLDDIENINQFNSTEMALYEISNNENVVNEVILKKDNLLEIDFKLKYNLSSEGTKAYNEVLYEIYSNKVASYFNEENETSKPKTKEYIDFFARSESRFMIGDEKTFSFNIDYFQVTAIQIPKSGGIYD